MSFREWKEVRLGEVADFQKGYAFKSKDFQDKGIKIVKVSNLTDDSIDKSSCVAIDEEKSKPYENYNLLTNDIIITTVGSWPTNPASVVGKVVNVPGDLNNSLLNQNAVRVRAKNNIDQNYLYYLLKSKIFAEYIVGTTQGSANQASITQVDIKSFQFNIPETKEQKSIGRILRAFDDKIQLNDKINKNLEEMAQAIFKRWFIDFEFPNENGEPYKSSGGEMLESEMGFIPKVWNIVKLADLGNIITGKTPSSKQIDSFGEKYNFITPRDISNSIYILKTERLLSEIGSERLKTIRIKKNSIGVSCIGSNLGEVYVNDKEGFTNQQINSIILDKEEIYPYLYITLKNMKEDFLNLAGGSAVPIINKTAFSAIKIIMPDESILNKFVERVTCLFEKVKNNLIENRNLTEIRDTLLPKLMSGEIRVPLDK